MYEKETKKIQFYWRAKDAVLDKKRLKKSQGIDLKQGFEYRYEKTKIQLGKQKDNSSLSLIFQAPVKFP